ncbi:MAG TPA: hypothetical protein VMF69_16275 [Gemmataceae bacterium]|nr:hypothetical protein [Gemmataceae bacterium]
MSVSLAEALEHMEPGRTYRCKAQGKVFELRVLAIPEELAPAPLVEEDFMLDAWVELPEPSEGFVTISHLGEPELPDPPIIPDEDAEE